MGLWSLLGLGPIECRHDWRQKSLKDEPRWAYEVCNWCGATKSIEPMPDIERLWDGEFEGK